MYCLCHACQDDVVFEPSIRWGAAAKALQQILGDIADGVKGGVPRLGHAFEMAGLGDRATAENANLQLLFRP